MTRVTRRLFFALWPTDEVRAALERAGRPALKACTGRAVPAHNYHVTLAFLGNQPAHGIERLGALASVSPPAFELVLDRFGHWSGPRVLWLGPRRCPAGLAALVAQIRAALDALGIDYDRHAFRAHLTLARKVTALPELPAPVPVHWPVRSFVLAESVTAVDGPVYRVVRRYPTGPFSGGSRHDPKPGYSAT